MPRKTETAATPRPSKQKTTALKASGGRPELFDWSGIRRAYIRGEDDVTFETLSHMTGSPKHGTIKNRAAREDWTSLRRDFRDQVMTKTRELDADLKVEVRRRHQEIGRDFMQLTSSALQYQNPEALEPVDIARFAKIGAELERKALGMEEVNVRLGRIKSPDDLDKLSETDLWQIAGMLPPEDDDDDL